MWFKMKFSLPFIREKISFFNDIKNILEQVKVHYNKGAAKIKHLDQLSKTLNEKRKAIGKQLFDCPQMDSSAAGASSKHIQQLVSQDDEFMRRINDKYEGAGGQSASNPIQGFTEGRRGNKESMLGRLVDRVGTSLREMFGRTVSIEEYATSLVDLIQYTYYIEEWLECVLDLKRQKQKDNKPFLNNDKISLEYLTNVSKFLQEVVLVIVLNDLKYLLSFYMIGMQNALVEDFTITQQQIYRKQLGGKDAKADHEPMEALLEKQLPLRDGFQR